MKRNEERIEKVVVETKVTYVSIDGKEFKTEEECRLWENSYKGTLTASMKQIPLYETNGDSAYLPGGQEDDEVWILRPRNFEDIKVINAYTDELCCGCKANLTQDDVGKLIALNFGYDHDWCGIYRVDEYLEHVKKAYEKFASKVDGTEDTEN